MSYWSILGFITVALVVVAAVLREHHRSVRPPSESAHSHPFSTDRPITSVSADILGRSKFAVRIARAVNAWAGKDSLVIGLYGRWGTGKTSVKNMVVEAIQQESSRTRIVHFNPWQWVGQDQLAAGFFRELGISIGKPDSSGNAKRRALKWKAYAAHLRVGGTVVEGAQGLVSWFFGIGVAAWAAPSLLVGVLQQAGLPLGTIGAALLQGVRLGGTFFTLIAGTALALLSWGGKLGEAIASAMTAANEAGQKDLEQIRTELSSLLRTSSNTVLVVIDDIDRLTPEQVRLLFQLVKANADLPNLVYLLLFQRDVVEQQLTMPGVNGREYLEKIVQVGFDLPVLEHGRIERLLFAGLDNLLKEHHAEARFDQQRWGNLYYPGLRPYFETLRDVHRFLSTISFHLAAMSDKGVLEVNPVDLIAVEALRVFEPDAFHRIARSKEGLTEIETFRLREDPETKALVEGIVETVTHPRREGIRAIIKALFPTVEWVLGGARYSNSWNEEWYRDLRVCHPHVFDRYFYLGLPEGDVSQAQIEHVLSLVADRAGLSQYLRELHAQGLLEVMLNRLEAYKQQVDLSHAVTFVGGLLDIGDILPHRTTPFVLFDAGTHAVRIILWYLRQAPDPKLRGQLLLRAMEESSAVYLCVDLTSSEEGRRKKEEPNPDRFLVDESSVPVMQAISLQKIEEAAQSGKLGSNPHLAAILFRWIEWAPADEVRDWVLNLVSTKEGLLQFLCAMATPIHSSAAGDYVTRTRWEMRLSAVQEFVPVERLKEALTAANLNDLGERERLAVDAFTKAVRRQEQGQPESSWMDAE